MKHNIRLLLIVLLSFLNLYSFAQIKYVNITPDIILQNTAYDSIDLDLDGVIDIKFTQEDSIVSLNANGTGVTLMHNNIEFVGLAPSYDPSHFYTYKLDSNIFIDQNAGGQLWVTKLGPDDAVRIMQMFFYNSPYHLGEWINGVVDGFLGIRIKINNLWHYGWIRMDVDVDAHKLTVKDFAYNLEAQKGIYTGQKDLFSHRFIEVSYNPSFCGNVIIYGRNNIPNLDYDKICRINSMGSLDSIGAVPATANPYFLYEDTNTVYSMMQYCVIPVTTDHIIGKSDTIASMYAQLSVDSNSNLVLSWTPYKNNDFSVYKVYKLDTSFGLSYGIDTVSNYMHSYTIPSTYVDSSNNEFYVIVNPFAHSNYVIRSTLANINPYHQIHPQAGFSYETLCTNCYYDFQFWDKSSANIKSWYWDFGDGSTSTHKNPWHSFSPGVWTVSLKVSNCFGEDSIVVQNAINVSSVESKVYDNNIEIFPNPVHNSLTIESKSQNPISHLRVISVEGKTVYERKNINMPIINLDMSSLAKGLYFVEIESNIGLLRKKIVLF